jgi:hypothetical protein
MSPLFKMSKLKEIDAVCDSMGCTGSTSFIFELIRGLIFRNQASLKKLHVNIEEWKGFLGDESKTASFSKLEELSIQLDESEHFDRDFNGGSKFISVSLKSFSLTTSTSTQFRCSGLPEELLRNLDEVDVDGFQFEPDSSRQILSSLTVSKYHFHTLGLILLCLFKISRISWTLGKSWTFVWMVMGSILTRFINSAFLVLD